MTPYLVGILFLVTSYVGKADSWTEMQGFLSDEKVVSIFAVYSDRDTDETD